MRNRTRQFRGMLPVLCLSALLATGCSRLPEPRSDEVAAAAVPVQWPGPDGLLDRRADCDVLGGEARPGASVVVALTDSVSPGRAPIPHNPSERLVFSHLYETLVTLDCAGRLQPGLASSWTCTEDSTLWVFKIRPGARFWDGSVIMAQDVADAWTRNQDGPRHGKNTPLWTWFNMRARAVSIEAGNTLAIRLPEPQARFPYLLAHPATAVAVRREGWNWPVGSGPLRLRAGTPRPLPDLICRPNIHHPRAPIWKELVFRVRPGTDPRDLAGGNEDLVLTRDLDVVRFYQDLPGYREQALPWDRIYVLVCPPEANPREGAPWLLMARSLQPSTDLTTTDARPWHDLVLPAGQLLDCPQLTGPIAGAQGALRHWELGKVNLDAGSIAFDRDDPAARELAQRLAALGPPDRHAEAVHGGALDFILYWQMSGAVVLPLDQEFGNGCLQVADLIGKAPWLQAAALHAPAAHGGDNPDSLVQAQSVRNAVAGDPADLLMLQDMVRPLALTRPWLITRGEWAGLGWLFDGTPRLEKVGRSLSPEMAP